MQGIFRYYYDSEFAPWWLVYFLQRHPAENWTGNIVVPSENFKIADALGIPPATYLAVEHEMASDVKFNTILVFFFFLISQIVSY